MSARPADNHKSAYAHEAGKSDANTVCKSIDDERPCEDTVDDRVGRLLHEVFGCLFSTQSKRRRGSGDLCLDEFNEARRTGKGLAMLTQRTAKGLRGKTLFLS
jgi:hypothetical protein